MNALIDGERDTGRVSSRPIERRAGCSIGTALHRSMLKTEAQLAGNNENPNPSRTKATAELMCATSQAGKGATPRWFNAASASGRILVSGVRAI